MWTVVGDRNVRDLYVAAVALVLAHAILAAAEASSYSGSTAAIIVVQYHFRLYRMVDGVSIVAGGTLGAALSPRGPMHPRGSMMHDQIRAIHIASIRHGIFLLRLMYIVFTLAIIAHHAVVSHPTLRHITSWLTLGLLGLRNDAGIHALIEGACHI